MDWKSSSWCERKLYLHQSWQKKVSLFTRLNSSVHWKLNDNKDFFTHYSKPIVALIWIDLKSPRKANLRTSLINILLIQYRQTVQPAAVLCCHFFKAILWHLMDALALFVKPDVTPINLSIIQFIIYKKYGLITVLYFIFL